MPYPLALLLIFSIVFAVAGFVYFYRAYRRRRLLKTLENRPFDPQWRRWLEKTVHYPHLDPAQKEAVERSILKFVWTRDFAGIGIEVTEEMKVVVAFYACLIVLDKKAFCYEAVDTVMLYARDFAAHQHHESGGIVTEGVFDLDGQADPSTVVLSWHDARHEATHHGRDNVIVHEFAHQLDFADGVPDGIPPLPKSFHERWKHVLEADFHALQEAYLHEHDPGKYRLLGDYAATDETEFFAVASERFFMRPHALKTHFPELFNLMREFYGVDPRGWDPE